MLTLDASLAIGNDVVFRDLAGEAVILDLASGHYFGLDPIGTLFWRLIAERGHLRAVHQALVEQFDVPPEVLEADILEFAGELTRRRLLVPCS